MLPAVGHLLARVYELNDRLAAVARATVGRRRRRRRGRWRRHRGLHAQHNGRRLLLLRRLVENLQVAARGRVAGLLVEHHLAAVVDTGLTSSCRRVAGLV